MAQSNRPTTEKPHIERLYDTLHVNQQRFVTLRIEHPMKTKAELAKMVGVKADTVYRWGDVVDRAYDQELQRVHEDVLQLRRVATLKAMRVQYELLDSDDDSMRERASRNILEWELGKATQSTELSGKDGGAIEHTVHQTHSVDDARDIIKELHSLGVLHGGDDSEADDTEAH